MTCIRHHVASVLIKHFVQILHITTAGIGLKKDWAVNLPGFASGLLLLCPLLHPLLTLLNIAAWHVYF